MTIDDILTRFESVKRVGDGWQALCPNHDDKRQSLSISHGDGGRVLIHCHAGCDYKVVLNAVGLKPRDLFRNADPAGNGSPRNPQPKSLPSAIYKIKNTQGQLIAIHERFDFPNGGKSFVWRCPSNEKGLDGFPTAKLPLYGVERLNEFNEPILLVEGEKAVEVLWKNGFPALSTVCGASVIPELEVLKPLAGRTVVLWPDNDDAGHKHMTGIAQKLSEIGCQIRWLEWPDAPNKGDAFDFFASDGTKEYLGRFVAQAPEWKPSQAQLSEAELSVKIRDMSLTDAGNGELIVLLSGDRLRFDHRQKRWLLWNNVRWMPDCDGEVDRVALEAARTRLRTSAGIPNEDSHKASAKWALRSESAYSRRAALEWAGSLKPIADSGESWDADSWLLGIENGVLDLHTGRLREGRREDKITMGAGVVFGHDATCPRWLQFLDEIFPSDRNLIDYIQRAIGYSLTGDTSEQCLFLCYGTGANGKTVFMTALRSALGDYAANTPFQTFEDIRSQTSTNDVAALYGKRLVTSAETKERTGLNEARVKAMTGGDPVTARFLFREFFSYVPTYKIWLAVNHKPMVTDESYGFWRRIRLIPFQAQFPPEKADKRLIETLKQEAPGILTWAVQGCLTWQRQGLEPPKIVTQATSEYQAESDLFGQFLEECCIQKQGLWCYAKALYGTYKHWCEQNNVDPISSTAFGRRLSERGFQKQRKERGNLYLGLALKAENYTAEECNP
ncbi:hypothetical protein HYR54_00585 [Candidatus Acetothermia bacterium]|nr:hypothetical protein [Candidatus Acetothermia bacterium]